MFCRFCGKTVPDDSRVCMYCGKTLELENVKKPMPSKETPLESNVAPLPYASERVLVEQPSQLRLKALNVFAWLFTTLCILFVVASVAGILLTEYNILPTITNYLMVPMFYVMLHSYLYYIAIGIGGLAILLSAIYMFANKKAGPVVSFIFVLLFAGAHILGLVWGYGYLISLFTVV